MPSDLASFRVNDDLRFQLSVLFLLGQCHSGSPWWLLGVLGSSHTISQDKSCQCLPYADHCIYKVPGTVLRALSGKHTGCELNGVGSPKAGRGF